jgi:delta 1-pyrroline-5-carboxylate dehydrogenase
MKISDEMRLIAARTYAGKAWPEAWEALAENNRAVMCDRMGAAIEAVAPAIRAAAMEEAAKIVERGKEVRVGDTTETVDFAGDEAAAAIRDVKGEG